MRLHTLVLIFTLVSLTIATEKIIDGTGSSNSELSLGSVELKINDSFKILLKENPTTGYSWQWNSKDNSVSSIVKLVSSVYEREGHS